MDRILQEYGKIMQNSSRFLIIYIVQLQHGVKEPKRYSWSLQPGEGHGFIPSELLCQRLATLDRGALVYQNSAQPRHHIKVLCASTWSYTATLSSDWIKCDLSNGFNVGKRPCSSDKTEWAHIIVLMVIAAKIMEAKGNTPLCEAVRR